MGISTTLNNSAYSLEISKTNALNSDIESEKEIRKQDDFYGAVNKEWLLNTKLEEGYISYGTFEEVCGKVNEDILNIILEIQKNKDRYYKNSEELKILNLYENYLNINKRDELGVKPIEKYINKISEIATIENLRYILGNDELSYFQPLINLEVGPDYKDSNINVLYISRSNLGLGNSFYYKDVSRKGNDIKEAYINYLIKLHTLYGETEEIAKKMLRYFMMLKIR